MSSMRSTMTLFVAAVPHWKRNRGDLLLPLPLGWGSSPSQMKTWRVEKRRFSEYDDENQRQSKQPRFATGRKWAAPSQGKATRTLSSGSLAMDAADAVVAA